MTMATTLTMTTTLAQSLTLTGALTLPWHNANGYSVGYAIGFASNAVFFNDICVSIGYTICFRVGYDISVVSDYTLTLDLNGFVNKYTLWAIYYY